jgi:aspartate-semialdehyde dehydrogenase
MPRENAGPVWAVVGATGAVGREVLGLLSGRGFPPGRVRALASERSAGRRLPFGEASVGVAALGPGAFEGCAVAVLCADASTARAHAPEALGAGTLVVDNSSAFRMDERVPLVVPEVNGQVLDGPDGPRLVANPNCTTIILVTALEPLRRAFGLEAVDVATYQAVSGAGLGGIAELHAQSRPGRRAGSPPPRVFHEPCAFNVFSHDSPVDAATGVNGEERKVIDETRRIWSDPGLRVTPTCLRVPVVRAHTEAITVTLAAPAGEREVREALAGARGLRLLDDRSANAFPTPLKATGAEDVLVGRVRPDPGEGPDEAGRYRRWCLLACGDQLRKGAALNAIQIAERLARAPV